MKRQLDLYDAKILVDTPITIAGCGGLGSLFALAARKSGFSQFSLFDKDIIEYHNVSNQMFSIASRGMRKVDALEAQINGWMPQDAIPSNVRLFPEFITKSTVLDTLVLVVAVDSMAARREIFEAFRLSEPCDVLLDLRMGAYNNQVHLADKRKPDTVKNYEGTLGDVGEELPCTGRAMFNIGMICAAQAALLLVQWLCGKGQDPTCWEFHHDGLNNTYYGKN